MWRLVDVLVAHQAIDPTYDSRVVAALVHARASQPAPPARPDANVIPIRRAP